MSPRRCLSVLIVTYNSRAHIRQCLAAVQAAGEKWLCECIAFDNASPDGTADYVRGNFPWVTVVANAENIGFGRAVNRAAAAAVGEYILLLNPDTSLKPAGLDELIAFLDSRSQAAAGGPRLVHPDGRFQYNSRRGFPTPTNSLGYLLRLDRLLPGSRRLGGYHRRYIPTDREILVDTLSGACMLIRRDAFRQVGGFDEDYFLFGEDIDLCWKFKQAGWEVWYLPSVEVVHEKGASMKFAEQRARREFFRAMRLFMSKRLRDRHSRIGLAIANAGVFVLENIRWRGWTTQRCSAAKEA